MEESEFDNASLFGPGFCEFCGREGVHPECAARAAEVERRFRETEAELLQRHSLHGKYGIVNEESARSYEQARAALERRLRRKFREDPAKTIEGDTWWYLPEMWIGVVGFIVEKESGHTLMIGSGSGGIQYATAFWCGIVDYLKGRIWVDAEGKEWYRTNDGIARPY